MEGDEFNKLPFYDNTFSKQSKWRRYLYTTVNGKPALKIEGNEVRNDVFILLDESVTNDLYQRFSPPREQVEFMTPDDPHKLSDDPPESLKQARVSSEGQERFWDTYWYRNIGRVTWEIGQGIAAVIEPIILGIVAIINQAMLIIPPVASAGANIIGHLSTSLTNAMVTFLQSAHYLIQAWGQIEATKIDAKLRLEETRDTNRVNLETWESVKDASRALPRAVDPKVVRQSSVKPNGFSTFFGNLFKFVMNILFLIVFFVVLFAILDIVNS
jgi:hypothetical protein